MDILHKMAEALIKYETIDASQLADLMAGKVPKEPEGWSSNSDNKPSSPSPSSDEKSSSSDSKDRSHVDKGSIETSDPASDPQ